MEVCIDPEHGGRWTSLRNGDREWLWQRPAAERLSVKPGDAFVDAGGLEECLPTIRGVPDHGDLWSRAWVRSDGDAHSVCTDSCVLERTVKATDQGVRADYRLRAEPGYRFVWAAHALLDLRVGARIAVPGATRVRLFEEAADLVPREWPQDAPFLDVDWPDCAGLAIGELGPDDGTAVGAVVLESSYAIVYDGTDQLRFDLAAPEQPTSFALWRNLGGFPETAPYRSVGVEPMLGQVFDLEHAEGDRDAVTVPATGEVTWSLSITSVTSPG